MKNLFYIFLLAVISAACANELEEEITWKLDKYPDQLVVEGSITNEFKHQSIHLTLTNSYFDVSAPRPVTDAVVTVSDGSNEYTFSEIANDGYYFSDVPFSGRPLREYTLNIKLTTSVNGNTDYQAVSTMPEGINIDSITCEIYEMPEFDFGGEEDTEEKDTTILGIYYFGKEPDNPNNYYLGRIYINGVPSQNTAKESLLFNDDYQNGGFADYVFFAENVQAQDTVNFKIYSIEEDYYHFIMDVSQMDQAGNAYNMSGPPANAIGNVKNALGYFMATYVSEKSGIAVDLRK